MREVQIASFKCFQFELPGRTIYKRRNDPRATSSSFALWNAHGTKTSLITRPSSCTKSSASHKCIAVDNAIKSKDSKQILVGSALRRPHASGFSPLDYQTMPDVGKAPKQPYRSQSAGTVYKYASRPMSAVQASTQHGKHTKSSLLRNKSASCDSIASRTSSCSSSGDSRPASANKRLCQIRDDYRFFKRGPTAKQIPPHGQSLHSFLTGARYNNSRCLDSRTLSKLGVYIPKGDLNTFFVNEGPPRECDPDDEEEHMEYNINMSVTQQDMSLSYSKEYLQSPETEDKAVNTDPTFMSLERWHSTEWQTDRKPTKEKAPRAHTAPSRFKPITTLYHDYNTGKKYQYGDDGT